MFSLYPETKKINKSAFKALKAHGKTLDSWKVEIHAYNYVTTSPGTCFQGTEPLWRLLFLDMHYFY
ncbi:hypothetical protein DM455_12080 [Legionella pneumophila]|nr:hypothetical protein DM454_12125 [Legionella pneumophila]PYB48357.1 hypothetical protein DM456_13505 [Legionella pneumophila]PYB60879.1 hypothetical protein DM455_12080 [Legionella pneumophila]TID57730.1 hypothetical protein DIZ40_13230 [Legionella pneumophila]TID58057.1 hypothetical protein DIZ38_13120 [Legionella pneumophila]